MEMHALHCMRDKRGAMYSLQGAVPCVTVGSPDAYVPYLGEWTPVAWCMRHVAQVRAYPPSNRMHARHTARSTATHKLFNICSSS